MKRQLVVSVDLARSIDKMIRLLNQEFGCDYAFVVMGRGNVIAASNKAHGVIMPFDDGETQRGNLVPVGQV